MVHGNEADIYILIHLMQFDGLISISIGDIVKGSFIYYYQGTLIQSLHLAPPRSTFDWESAPRGAESVCICIWPVKSHPQSTKCLRSTTNYTLLKIYTCVCLLCYYAVLCVICLPAQEDLVSFLYSQTLPQQEQLPLHIGEFCGCP